MTDEYDRLLEELLNGDHRALARVITKIENRSPGYRDLVSDLHAHTGGADVVGITGSPGLASRRSSTSSQRPIATAD